MGFQGCRTGPPLHSSPGLLFWGSPTSWMLPPPDTAHLLWWFYLEGETVSKQLWVSPGRRKKVWGG